MGAPFALSNFSSLASLAPRNWELVVGEPSGHQVTIANEGGVDLILTAMQQHRNEDSVQEKACAALRTLAADIAAENVVTLSLLLDVLRPGVASS